MIPVTTPVPGSGELSDWCKGPNPDLFEEGGFLGADELYFSGGDYLAHQLCCRGQSLSGCWSYKSSPGSNYLLLWCQPKGQHVGRGIPKESTALPSISLQIAVPRSWQRKASC